MDEALRRNNGYVFLTYIEAVRLLSSNRYVDELRKLDEAKFESHIRNVRKIPNHEVTFINACAEIIDRLVATVGITVYPIRKTGYDVFLAILGLDTEFVNPNDLPSITDEIVVRWHEDMERENRETTVVS